MNSILTIVQKVYHIKNLGDLVEIIKVPKKISDHPIIIFQKELPFKRLNDSLIINIINKEIEEKNIQELQKTLLNKNLSYSHSYKTQS